MGFWGGEEGGVVYWVGEAAVGSGGEGAGSNSRQLMPIVGLGDIGLSALTSVILSTAVSWMLLYKRRKPLRRV